MTRRLVLLGCGCATLASCAEKKTYDPRRIELLAEIVRDQGVEIAFGLPEEGSHYCAGADFTVSGDEIRFRLVRARVGEYPKVDAEARREEDGSYLLAFPWDWQRSKTVELVDATGRKYGAWTMKEETASPVE